jgi:histone H1/5
MKVKEKTSDADVQAKINKLQALIDNPDVSEKDKANFRDALSQFKAKMTSEKKEVVKKPTSTLRKPMARKPTNVKMVAKKAVAKKPMAKKPISVKPKKKPITAKVAEKKTPKGVVMLSKNKVSVNGVEMDKDSKEFCDYLTAEFVKRKEQAKKNKGTRTKTKSVMAQVSTKIEQGVEKAIKTGISKQKPALSKNPQVFIGKVEKLETATKNFLTQLKEVLGTDYDAKEVTDTTKAIHKLIEDLKKKYVKK